MIFQALLYLGDSVRRLQNGNTLFVNCHAGQKSQIIEVTPDKEVVWTYRDFDFWKRPPVAVVEAK